MSSAVCLTLGAMHLAIWNRKRDRWPHLLFALAIIPMAVSGMQELAMMNSLSGEAMGRILRWTHVPIIITAVAIAAFIRTRYGVGRMWLFHTVWISRLASLVLNFASPVNLNFTEMASPRRVLLGGETVSTLMGTFNPLTILGQFSLFLLAAYVLDATISLWRGGGSKRSIVVCACFVVTITLGALQALMIFRWQAPIPLMHSILFLPVLLAMGWDLAREVIEGSEAAIRLRASEAELRESRRQIDLSTDTTGVGLWVWDIEKNNIWTTPRCREIFGVGEAEAITFERFEGFVHQEDLELLRASVGAAFSGLGQYECEYRIVMPDGSIRWISARGNVEFAPEGKPRLMRGAMVDTTTHRQAQEDADRHKAEVVHLGRVASLGELTSAIAHELNQPLAAILANAQAGRRFITSGHFDEQEHLAILDDIVQDDKRAAEVVHRLRAMVRKEPSLREPICPNELTRQVVQFLRGEIAAHGVRLDLALADEVPPFLAGRIEMQQVLINLLMNAMQALKERPRGERLVRIETTQGDGVVRIEVRDKGPGIPGAILQRIFDPFVTTRAEGMGMGMAICRRLVEAFGGQVQAANPEGGGALVTVEMPAAAPDAKTE